jgi:hypothetical protein
VASFPINAKDTRAEALKDLILGKVVRCMVQGCPKDVKGELLPFGNRKVELDVGDGKLM